MGLKEAGLRGSLRSTSSVLPAFFDVTITNTNSPVQEGDILTVDYSADNTGDAQDTQDIRLEIDSVEEDRDSDITLLGAQSTTGTLEWDTTNEDETTYTATVLSDDNTDSVTVEIEAAIPDSVVEDFERDEPLDDWSGNTGEWVTTITEPLEGDQSAVCGSDSQSGSLIYLEESQTGRLPERGDRFSFLMRTTSINEINFEFAREGGTGTVDGYAVGVRPYIPDLTLREPGSADLIDDKTIDPDDYVDENIEVEIDFQDPTITVTTFEFDVSEKERGDQIDQISGDDTARDDGDISLAGGEDSEDRIVDRIWITPTTE